MPISFAQEILIDHPVFIQISEITFNQDFFDNPITSTGNSYLVFVYGNFTIKNSISNNQKPPKYYITPIDNAYKLSAKGKSSFIAIRMAADRFKTITGLDTAKYIDQQINLNTIIPDSVCHNLWNRLKENPFSAYQSIIDQEFSDYYNQWEKPTAVTPILEYIKAQNGMLNVSDLLEKFHLSHSTINRCFKTHVGFTTNKFIRLIRFNYLMRHLETNSDLLIDLIEKYQYYDYSHFSKDFKLFTGQSPKQYQGKNHQLLKDIIFKKINY